ncbi:MAG: DUF488 family protein [Chloroflexi bacterium]|nr:DUF488 family protein [Chloroflexota bacterium]GIW11066.1 MAG: hypothetical protein KatS3mg061_2123 [Dehalococcoidia bacterium]
MAVEIRRLYDDTGQDPAYRVLVDRLWPRGVRRDSLRLDAWLKELAPSDALRQWYGHDPSRWEAFRARYRAELEQEPARSLLEGLARRAARETVLLLYSARDRDHNQAVVLKELIDERFARQEGRPSDPPLQ